jgi:type I restriction enzyme S subunit
MIANTKFLRETALFTTLPILNNQTIGYYSLIYPKDISEQKQIADYLDKECSRIDKIISYREEKIEKLEEYKKSLIYECVTGKKEVL